MKRFTKILFLLVMVCAFFGLAYAQVSEPIEIDTSTAAEIFYAGIAGIPVLGLVELLKRKLNTHGALTVIVSVVVSAAATGLFLWQVTGFTIVKFVILTAIVALAANGIYLFPRRREA